MEIPDCYDPIYQAERREQEADLHRLECRRCRMELYGADKVYSYDGENLCGDCCKDAILEDLNILTLAELVGIVYHNAEELVRA